MLFGQNLRAENQFSQLPKNSTEMKIGENRSDPLGRSNPRGTVKGLFKSLVNNNYNRATKYFNLPPVLGLNSDSLSIPFVKKFEIELNRNGKILPVNIIAANSEGNLNDGLDPVFEEVGSLIYNGNSIPIFLERVQRDQEPPLWLISSATLDPIVEGFLANPDLFDEQLGNNKFLSFRWQGAPLSDWLIVILTAIGAYLLTWLFTILLGQFARSLFKIFREGIYSQSLKTLLIPLRLVLAVLIFLNITRFLELSIVVRQTFSVVNLFAMWTAFFVFVWLLIDTTTTFGEVKLRKNKKFGALSAVSFFRNTAKFLLIIIALLVAFSTVGVNVTAGLAALGVGGLALALGAQKTIENIVGGLSVVFDQPVSVGDFCKFGDTLGTVEKIGMRSTRIRTLGRTVVTIPNSDFSTRLIENYSKRDLFLYRTKIGLRYETSCHQMRFILVELRKILYSHPKVDPDPARVRFLGYANDCLQVELYAYTYANDWSNFLGIQEDINLRLANVIEESGSAFAFPSQTLYLSRDQELSKEKKIEVEKKVQKWIDNDELKLPDFDEETIQSLRNGIKFPS